METVFRGKFWRIPFYQDNHPTYKESTGQAWMGWRECDKVWYIYNMQGFPQGSIASKDYQFGLDIIKMPNGDVSCPPLDPNMGSNGTCKFFCVNGNQHEAVLLLRKRKLNTLGASAKKKARPRPTQAKPTTCFCCRTKPAIGATSRVWSSPCLPASGCGSPSTSTSSTPFGCEGKAWLAHENKRAYCCLQIEVLASL